jgi:hypothetical protein
MEESLETKGSATRRMSWGRAALSAFQAAPRKTIIAEISIHTIKPIAAARPPNTSPYFIFRT